MRKEALSPNTSLEREIVSYDYGSDSYQWEYDVSEQGVIQLRTFNGKLFVPGIDPQGSGDWGNFYVYDGSSWAMKSTIPNAIHVLDLIWYQGAMYATTGTGPDMTGKIYKSTDEGETWMEAYNVAPVGSDFRRFYMMGIYQDTLYVQSDLKEPEGKVLFRFDGNNWTTIPFDSLVSSVGKLEQFNDEFYFLNGPLMHIYNGLEWQTVNLPFSGWQNDPQHTGKRIQKSMCFYKDEIYGGGEEGQLYKSTDGLTWDPLSISGSVNEEIETIEVYHGRLYVGVNDTTGTGKVYVSASVPSGILVSEKYNFVKLIAAGSVNWSVLTPSPLSSVRFQVRTALSQNGLEIQQFTGPDGTPQSFFEISGQSLHESHLGKNWIQYKVFMTSVDDAYTPALQEVSISAFTYTGINQDKILEAKLNCFPNPFTSGTRIVYSLMSNSMVELEIINMNGQQIIQLVNKAQNQGEHSVILNVPDLPPGIYLCVLKTNKGRQIPRAIVKKLIKQ